METIVPPLAERDLIHAFECVRDVALAIVTPDGRIAAWCEGASDLFGYTSREIMGHAYQELMMTPTALSEGSFTDVSFHRRNGSIFRTDGSFHAVTDERGTAVCWLLTINLHTESEHQHRAKLEIAKNAAEAANVSKSAFLANISHEIRTPLGAILGFAELMNDPHINALQRKELLSTIRRSGEMLTGFVNDLLDLSRVESGRMRIESTRFQLATVIKDVVALLRMKAGEKNINIEASVLSPIPAEIISDPTRLRQILMNVIGNAIKFSSKGSIGLEVSFETKSQTLRFEVADQGIGVSPDKFDAIFEPFSQAANSSVRKPGDTGLGLVVSRRLARAMGGDLVLLTSEPGKGSRFALTLCQIMRPTNTMITNLESVGSHASGLFGGSTAGAAVGASNGSTSAAAPLAGTQILFVEDSPDNQFLVGYFLRAAGATVEFAGNGEEGVQKGLKKAFDAILMDIQMPVMDGYTATKMLRQGGFTAPIIALTAHAMREERERCLSAGCTDHMTKPVDRATLVTQVADHIRRYRTSSKS